MSIWITNDAGRVVCIDDVLAQVNSFDVALYEKVTWAVDKRVCLGYFFWEGTKHTQYTMPKLHDMGFTIPEMRQMRANMTEVWLPPYYSGKIQICLCGQPAEPNTWPYCSESCKEEDDRRAASFGFV